MNSVFFVCVFGCLLGEIYGNPDLVTERDLEPSTGIDTDSMQQEVTTTSISRNDQSGKTSNDLMDAILGTNFASNSSEEFDSMDSSKELSDSKDKEYKVDENGCQITLRDELEGQCFDTFEHVLGGSIHIKDTAESEKTICCALEEYEKCSVRGYRRSNCAGDKESLKENLKAARIFIGALTNISCSGHRGRCVSTSSGNIALPYFLSTVIAPFLMRFF